MHGGFEARMKTQQKYEWKNNDPVVREHIDRVKEHTSRKRPGRVVLLADERKCKVKKEGQDKQINDTNIIILAPPFVSS